MNTAVTFTLDDDQGKHKIYVSGADWSGLWRSL